MSKNSDVKDEHNKKMMIENLIWEIARLHIPNSYIDPKIIKKAKDETIKILDHN